MMADSDSSAGIEKLIRSYLANFAAYSASTSPETLAGANLNFFFLKAPHIFKEKQLDHFLNL